MPNIYIIIIGGSAVNRRGKSDEKHGFERSSGGLFHAFECLSIKMRKSGSKSQRNAVLSKICVKNGKNMVIYKMFTNSKEGSEVPKTRKNRGKKARKRASFFLAFEAEKR